jgi:hypothetical protein
VVVNEFFRFSCLCDADCESTIRQILPFILAAEKPRNLSHKVHAALSTELRFEELFGLVGETKIFKVVHVDTNVDGRKAGLEGAVEDAWIMRTHGESHVEEYLLNGLVPVVRTATQTVECLAKEPQIANFTKGASFGRTEDDGFVLR